MQTKNILHILGAITICEAPLNEQAASLKLGQWVYIWKKQRLKKKNGPHQHGIAFFLLLIRYAVPPLSIIVWWIAAAAVGSRDLIQRWSAD